ncbi:hypothetical protein [Pedobacter sp. L105]|uniref:hypothetical protein n=1 Tax=Pedobacter sp. L105 TaxID=1641871 RepID=UPI00131DE6B8|nr:hypothetical protein [Pedobacter sp. L105]
METFLEILITAILTFTVGFLCVRYKPNTKRRQQNFKIHRPKDKHVAHADSRNHSVKFILLFLMGMIFISSVFYLVQQGYVIIKW